MSTKANPFAAASAIALAVSLGGCQMLGLGGGMASASSEEMRSGIPADFGAQQLADGRKALTEGRTADAIDSFMMAKTFPDQSAAAFNGLAVAYSRIGRADLAERFFHTAVALAPSDDRYRENLALFYSRASRSRDEGPAIAMEQAPVQPEVRNTAIAPVARPVRALGGGLSVQSPPAHVTRVSLNEVQVGSPAMPLASAAGRGGHRAVIEVGATRTPNYPIRVALAAPRANGARPGYPIRIELDH